MKNPIEAQQQYYSATASQYDAMHVSDEDAHGVALRHISGFIATLGITSILDVGCGTGRGIQYFLKHHPALKVRGVEPVQALIDRAVGANKIPVDVISLGSGEHLPFENESFDAVCAFGVLHHAQDPSAIVKEMMRVAKVAVFISDSNRFGQRSVPLRLLKLILYKLHLWNLVNFVKTRGRGYTFTEGDGLSYSYSVFDSYKVIVGWAQRVEVIPTESNKKHSRLPPILASGHILLYGFKESQALT